MKIILTNGQELNPLMVTGGSRYVNGANRDALTFIFGEEADVNELDAIFTEQNCETIKFFDAFGNSAIHNDYTIRVEMKTAFEESEKETPDHEAVNVKRTTVTMAQKSFVEKTLLKIANESTNTQLAVAELAELVVGGM